jgi:hypothetical protein
MAPGGYCRPESEAVGGELAGSRGRTKANAETPRGSHRRRCKSLPREEMTDPSSWRWTLAVSRERRSDISSQYCRSRSPARSMRSQSTHCASTPKGRDEMHLAVGTDRFHKP